MNSCKNNNQLDLFYPSLDTLNYIEPKQNCTTSREISKRIIALPIYPELTEEEQSLMLDIIKNNNIHIKRVLHSSVHYVDTFNKEVR